MYKKYIKKRGKKIGPYYYNSVRLRNGKVKTIYLGNNLNKARTKLFILKKKGTKKKDVLGSSTTNKKIFISNSKRKELVIVGEQVIVPLVLFLVLIGFFYSENFAPEQINDDIEKVVSNSFSPFILSKSILENSNSLTARAIFEDESFEKNYEEKVGLIINESLELSLSIKGINKLKWLKINGRLAFSNNSEGDLKIFVENKNLHETYLLFDSKKLDEERKNLIDYIQEITGAFFETMENLTTEEYPIINETNKTDYNTILVRDETGYSVE